MSKTQLVAALRERLRNEASADRFAGAVLVADQGKPIFAQAYGLADREHNIPNTLETRFSIASMNKMFTAVATMQLVQAGNLALDDPLGKYLTDYPNKELAAKVTIGELLSGDRSLISIAWSCGPRTTTSIFMVNGRLSLSQVAVGSTATTASFCSAL
jgi:D-alanyl-D-alanine carboxypeptidase